MDVRKMARLSIIIAMASAVHFLEGLLPPLILALPGARLGLANVFGLFVLRLYRPLDALLVTLLRCLVGTLLMGGSPSGLMYSLAGGLFSWAVMASVLRLFGEHISLMGASMAGAAAHNTAQVAMASVLLGSRYVFPYLTGLLPLAIPTGIFTGYLCTLCIKAVGRLGIEGA